MLCADSWLPARYFAVPARVDAVILNQQQHIAPQPVRRIQHSRYDEGSHR